MKPVVNHSDDFLARVTEFCGLSNAEITEFLQDSAAELGRCHPVNPESVLHLAHPTSGPSLPNPTTPPNSSIRNANKRSAAHLLQELTLDDKIEQARTNKMLDDCEREIKRFRGSWRQASVSPSFQHSAEGALKGSRIATKSDSHQLPLSPNAGDIPAKKMFRIGRARASARLKGGKSASVSDKKDQDERIARRPRSPSKRHLYDRGRSQAKNTSNTFVEAEEGNATTDKPPKSRRMKGVKKEQTGGDRNANVPKRSRRTRTGNDEECLAIPAKRFTPNSKGEAAGPKGTRSRDPEGSIPSNRVLEAVHIPHGEDLEELEAVGGKKSKSASRKAPRERILDFARNTAISLAKLDKQEEGTMLKKRCCLATFVGCENFESVSVAAYFRALCVLHKEAVGFATLSNKDEKEQPQVDGLRCDVDEEKFSKEIMAGVGTTGTRESKGAAPLFLESTVDVLQLILRLWQKMSTGDQDITEGFMKSLYEGGAVRAIAELLTSIIRMWQKKNASIEHEHTRSDLVEYAIRLLANVFSFELSPVSIIPASIKLSDLGIREKDEHFSLPQLLDVVLDYVGHEAVAVRECRLAASEICQIYIYRHHFGFRRNGESEKAWEKFFKANEGHVQSVMQHRAFWPLVVHTAIQTVKKGQQGRDNKVAVAFLVSLLSEPAALRSLLESQTKVRHALLDVFLKILDRVGRDPVNCFRESEFDRISYPGLPSVLDLVRRLMSFAVVQREVVSSIELAGREMFLGAIENLLTRVSKLIRGTFDTTKLEAAAESGVLGKLGDDLQRALSVQQSGRGASQGGTESESEAPETAKLKAVAVYRSLAFAAWLIGSLGKSMEDGSRDMSQMNGLQVLLSSKYKNTRALRRLWTDVIKIQSCVEEKIPLSVLQLGGSTEMPDLSREVLLSVQDRNHFSMVVEGIRQRLASDLRERRARSSPLSLKQSSDVIRTNSVSETKSEANFSFPNVAKVRDLRAAVCLEQGHRYLDDDPQMLALLEKVMRSEAEDVLSRYDVDSDIMFQWVRLQKRNAYVGNAREFLDKVDKTLGHPCSCLPGNPTESGNGNQNHIACANDVCENRSTKVECVPGECGAGSYCQNQRLQKQEYARVKIQFFPKKGLGVVANEEISAGTFIGEYQGEVISNEEFEERRKIYKGEKHFYFMTLTSKLVIDASRKSQFTRFVNHSCDPNAETQKWNAGGEPRVGIFASRKIPKGEEITFDYGASSLENDSVPCLCGATKCRGVLTSKKENVKEDDVPIDESGLANPESSPKKDAMSKDKLQKAECEERELLEEKLKEKIKKAKKRLSWAAELNTRKSEAQQMHRLSDESSLSQQMKSRLAEWESSFRKRKEKPKTIFPLNNASSSKPEARVRIPRRPQQSILITHAAHLKKKEEEEMASRLSKNSHKKPAASAIRRHENPKTWYQRSWYNSNRMGAPQDSVGAPERPGTKPSASASKPATTNRPQAPKKAMPVFAPTSTKFKRPLLKPKTAERIRKKKRDDEDSDSLDGYSTASSVEPIMEEPEHSDIPDGLGACSDDEFVEAPPIIPEPENRDSARRDGSYRDQGHDQAGERRVRGEREHGHPLRGVHQGPYEGHRSPRFRSDYRNEPHMASRTGNGAYDRYEHGNVRRSPPSQGRFDRPHSRSGFEGPGSSLVRQDKNMNRSGYVTEGGRDLSHRRNQDLEWNRITRNEPVQGTDYRKNFPPNPEQRHPRVNMERTARGYYRGNSRAEGERDNPFSRESRGHHRDSPLRSNHQERGNLLSSGSADPRGSHPGDRSAQKIESRALHSGHQGRGSRFRTANPSGKALDKDVDRPDKQTNAAALAHQSNQHPERKLYDPGNHDVEMGPNSISHHESPRKSLSQGNLTCMHSVGPEVAEGPFADNRVAHLSGPSAGDTGAGNPLPINVSETGNEKGSPEKRSEENQQYHPGEGSDGIGKEKLPDVPISKQEKDSSQRKLSKESPRGSAANVVKQELLGSKSEQKVHDMSIPVPQEETGGAKSSSRPGPNGTEGPVPGSKRTVANATNSSDIGSSLAKGCHPDAPLATEGKANRQNKKEGSGDEKGGDMHASDHDLVVSGRRERPRSPVKRSGRYTSRFERRVDAVEGGPKRARNDNEWAQGREKRLKENDGPSESTSGRHISGHERAPGRGPGVLDRVGRRLIDGPEPDARRHLEDSRRLGAGGGYGRRWSAEQGGNRQRTSYRGERWSPRWDGRRPRSPYHDRGQGRYSGLPGAHLQGRMRPDAGGMDGRVNPEHASRSVGQRVQEQRRGQDGERGGKDLRSLIQKKSGL